MLAGQPIARAVNKTRDKERPDNFGCIGCIHLRFFGLKGIGLHPAIRQTYCYSPAFDPEAEGGTGRNME